MLSRTFRVCALGFLLVAACSSSERSERGASSSTPPTTMPSSLGVHVAHRDVRVGVPSFVWISRKDLPAFTGAREAAKATLEGLAPTFALHPSILSSIGDVEIHDAGAGPIVARVKQRIADVDVFRGSLNILLNRAFEPIAASGLLVPTTTGSEAAFVLDRSAALDHAWARMSPGKIAFFPKDTVGDYDRFAAPGLAQPARVKKVLFPTPGADASGARTVVTQPAYYVEIMLASGPARSFVVSATDGSVLFENDLVRHDAFSYRVYGSPSTLLPDDGPQGNAAVPLASRQPDGFKPAWQSPSLVTLANFPFSKNDPWLAANATTTSGNNVAAYADLAAPDGFAANTTDVSPALSSANTFDYTYDTAQSPTASVAASVTQLFYVTNFLHDWYYDAGFDEKSGNHQESNFGRGGSGGDPLLAEAQDYSGRNNANAATPADGASPRMQMFVFSGQSASSLTVTAPAAIAGEKTVGLAAFGKDSFDLSGQVVLADDAQGADTHDACEALSNDVTGKIVLVHRGSCSFVQKIQNVQAAGGSGVLVANVATSASPDQAPYMGGTSSAITIPALSLALADGLAIEGATAAGVQATMKRSLQTDLDGALDTMVVSHEWGHVLSNRLIADGNGLTSNQAGGLGEGWGDFSALLVMARADDAAAPGGANWEGVYPNGAYATSGGGQDFYYGIRRVPYSTDLTKDPLTFKHIENGVPLPTTAPISFGEDGSSNAEVHNTGEIWATMLWECYASLLRAHPFADAQARMKRYLVSSLKLTPPEPTLLEARDAVLAAAFAADRDDSLLFWKAFAKRGAGVGATGPGKDSVDNGGVVESFFVGNDVAIDDAKLADDSITCDHDGMLDPGEVGSLTLTVRNAGVDTLQAPTVRVTSKQVELELPDGEVTTLGPLAPFETTTVKVKVKVRKGQPDQNVAIDVAVSDASIPDGGGAERSIPTRYQADQVAESSATDNVDTTKSAWKAGASRQGGIAAWARTQSGANGWWAVADVPQPVALTLTSPPFTVEGTAFGIAFKHRWSYRFSTRRGVDVDGGVVELTVDGGKTWKDVSEYGAIDYNTTLDDSDRTDNPLKGRKAYGNVSVGYPDRWITSRIAVSLPAQPEAVQLRFRSGTATGFAGAPGWEIDDIELSGISSLPFWSFVPHEDACDGNGPTVFAGDAQTVPSRAAVTLLGSGSDPSDLPLTYFWTQEAGPTVATTGADSATLSFIAPDVTAPVTLSFALRAHDGALLSPASKVDVNVTPFVAPATSLTAGGGGCSTSGSSHGAGAGAFGAALAACFVALRRRRSR